MGKHHLEHPTQSVACGQAAHYDVLGLEVAVFEAKDPDTCCKNCLRVLKAMKAGRPVYSGFDGTDDLTDRGARVVQLPAPKMKKRPANDPNIRCRDCDVELFEGQGRSVFDISSMFLGKSALVCESCWAARARDLKDAEQALVEGGFEIVHVPEELDDGWLNGRYHVHKDGCCYGAHSYRDDAVRRAYGSMYTPVTTSCYAQKLGRITP